MISLASTCRAAAAGTSNPGTLVLIHGLDSTRFTWNPFLNKLSSHTEVSSKWNVVALDIRGHGESPMGAENEFTSVAVARDIHHTLHSMNGISFPVVLVGHSMGGRVAMQYTDLFPDDLAAVVIEDMDIRPRHYAAPSEEDWVARRAFSREFPTWDATKAALLNWYHEDRIDSWRDDGRVFEKTRGENTIWWSGINPLAQQLARSEVLGDQISHDVWKSIGAKCRERNIPLHLFVAGLGSSCDPDSVHSMRLLVETTQVTHFNDAHHSIHNTALEAFTSKILEIMALDSS